MPGLTILHGCRTVQLTRGMNSLVDETDFWCVCASRWRAAVRDSTVYAARNLPRPQKQRSAQPTLLHRLLLDAPKGLEVDHINGDGLDNRRCNLRIATKTQNRQNIHMGRGACRFKGVQPTTQSKRWMARIQVNGKSVYLGCFRTQEDAARAYDRAARCHHGEFARTNADLYGDY